jgi:hypothetical protein
VLGDFRLAERELRSQIVAICWHMRGSVGYGEAWRLTAKERKDIMKFVEGRIKLTEKTGLPLL